MTRTSAYRDVELFWYYLRRKRAGNPISFQGLGDIASLSKGRVSQIFNALDPAFDLPDGQRPESIFGDNEIANDFLLVSNMIAAIDEHLSDQDLGVKWLQDQMAFMASH